MGEYVVAFDDAGGIEPLVRWDGTFIEGDHPVTTLTWVMLSRKDLRAFEERWTHLRAKIQRELGCHELPPIHMRLMYGRTLPRKYRGRRNPYLDASFEQILGWVEDAYRVVWTFGRRSRKLELGTVQNTRLQMAQPLQAYLRDPALRAELLFMEEQCRIVGKKRLAERYLKRVGSPLLALFREALIMVIEVLKEYRAHNVDLLIDSFHDSHGIDADDVVQGIQALEGLDGISSVQRVDADDIPLVQASDVMGWFAFRKRLFELRGSPPDPLLQGIAEKYPFGGLTNAEMDKIKRRVGRNYSLVAPPAQGVFYLVAKRVVEMEYPAFAEEHMVTVEELMKRIAEIQAAGTPANGIPILRDASVCGHLIPQNGEDPGCTGAP